MLILIAESKTMLSSEMNVSAEEYAAHTPLSESVADDIMGSLRGLNVGELAHQTGLTPTLASRMQKAIYDFGLKATGNPAIESYTGVVFKALDYKTLSEEGKNRCNSYLRIISSLYGWLRPEDIIKPYRLDFNTKLDEGPSSGRTMSAFWRAENTKFLVKAVQEYKFSEILNLMPADAAKSIDWKLVKHFAKVWKVDFQEMLDGGVTKTPTANRLKTLRGLLLRQIVEEGIEKVHDLIHTVSPNYVCEGATVYPDHLNFLC